MNIFNRGINFFYRKKRSKGKRHAHVLLAIGTTWTEVVEVFENHQSAVDFKEAIEKEISRSNVKYYILTTELRESE